MLTIIADKILYNDVQVARLTPETCSSSQMGEFIDEFNGYESPEPEDEDELKELKEKEYNK